MRVDIESLRSFVAVASAGSFTRAAEELYVTQPTLSRRVRELEHELHAPLFVRESRTIRLTSEGQALRHAAAQVIHDFDMLPLVVQDAASNSKDTHKLKSAITFGYQIGIDDSPMMKAFNRLQRRYPHSEIYLRYGQPVELERLRESRSIDVSFILRPAHEGSYDPEDIVLARTSVQLMVPHGHPFASRDSVDISELEDQDFIMFERRLTPELSDFIVSRCFEHGFSLRAKRYIADVHDGAMLSSVGKGIAFTSPMTRYMQPINSIDVRVVDIAGADFSLNYVAHMREDLPEDVEHVLTEIFDEIRLRN